MTDTLVLYDPRIIVENERSMKAIAVGQEPSGYHKQRNKLLSVRGIETAVGSDRSWTGCVLLSAVHFCVAVKCVGMAIILKA